MPPPAVRGPLSQIMEWLATILIKPAWRAWRAWLVDGFAARSHTSIKVAAHKLNRQTTVYTESYVGVGPNRLLCVTVR